MVELFKRKKKAIGRVSLGKGELKNCVLIVCMKSLLDFQREIPSTQLDTCTGYVEPNTTGSRESVSQLWLKIGHALGESAPLKLLNSTNHFFFFFYRADRNTRYRELQ